MIRKDLQELVRLNRNFRDEDNKTYTSMDLVRQGFVREMSSIEESNVVYSKLQKTVESNWRRLPVQDNQRFPARVTLLTISKSGEVFWSLQYMIYKPLKKCLVFGTVVAYHQCFDAQVRASASEKNGRDLVTKTMLERKNLTAALEKYIAWQKNANSESPN